MTDVTNLDSLYKIAPVVVWVEDTLTRDYLRACWGTPTDVGFLVAGTTDAIPQLVQTARAAGIRHVFGVMDRDFSDTNRDRWEIKGNDVFRWPRHEIENYLLDAEALAGCELSNRNRTPIEIQQHLADLAGKQPAWLACRAAVRHIRHGVIGTFPRIPKLVAVPDAAAAVAYIRGCGWLTTAGAAVAEWVAGENLDRLVREHFDRFAASVAAGGWLADAAGKEIFRPTRDFVYVPHPRSTTNPDNDLAIAVGRQQHVTNRVPADVATLLAALRFQVG